MSKIRSPEFIETASRLTKKFEGMLTEIDWSKATKQRAVDIFEVWLLFRSEQSKKVFPPAFGALILEAARAGMRKGANRRGVSKSAMTKFQRDLAHRVGRIHKAELIAQGMKATGNNSAEEKAAEDAVEMIRQVFGNTTLKKEAMIALLKRKPK